MVAIAVIIVPHSSIPYEPKVTLRILLALEGFRKGFRTVTRRGL